MQTANILKFDYYQNAPFFPICKSLYMLIDKSDAKTNTPNASPNYKCRFGFYIAR